MTMRRRTSVRSRTARGLLCGLALLLPAWAGEPCWPARPDLLTGPAGGAGTCFTVVPEGTRLRIRLDYEGRTFTPDLPAVLKPPLDGPIRLRDPWATLTALKRHKPLLNLGWNLWDGRPATVRAVAAGTVAVCRTDAAHGLLLEVDHGSGLRTRYALGRYASSVLAPGISVAAGDVLGELGMGLPDDIPFVHLGLLLEVGGGRWLALDPAPLFFASAANRALPLATSVLNAAVRTREPEAITRLLGLGLDPNAQAVDGTTPLEWAIMNRDAATARLLVAAGADPATKTAGNLGYVLEGLGLTLANTGPTLQEMAREMDDPELEAALAKP